MLPIRYSLPLPLDVERAFEDARSVPKIWWHTAGFLASSIAGGALRFRRQSGHSLTNQLIARGGETRHSMVW
jgi:hypothetical protein